MKDNFVKGLTDTQVNEKRSIGLSNEIVDSYNSTYLQIYLRNIFSLINIVLIPLLITLGYFSLFREILAFSTFLVINTAVSILDEVRIKRKLEKLKEEFKQDVRVIRDGRERMIMASDVVEGDSIIVREGEGIIADGEIILENYLQVDESTLTGESNYIRKDLGDKVLSGSYVVTGECIYVVEKVGKGNYLNKLGSEAVKIREEKSHLQKASDKIILFLVISSILAGGLNLYFSLSNGATYEEAVLSLTTVIVLIIPQTLIFLFTLTFTISITKLYSKGILVQKGGAIEDLSNVDVICFDKTGTITTNKMFLKESHYINLDEKLFGSFYNSVRSKLVGVNSTQKLINQHFSDYPEIPIKDFDQVPINSKQKFSLITGMDGKKRYILSLGAFSTLEESISKDKRKEVLEYVENKENGGFRVLIGIFYTTEKKNFDIKNPLNFSTSSIVIFTIEEELNPGVREILNNLSSQNIKVKIISGDSKLSVQRVCQKVGIDSDEIVDLSSEDNIDLSKVVDEKSVFTRAKPEDKFKIIEALRNKGYTVAMVGDGINDVLGLKGANVSISMESGAKIARDISDIVLLSNDYSKIPEIFYEGDNIIYNLKLSTKIFLVKSFFALLISIFYTLNREVLPIHPASALIFSFLGSSAPSYVLVFTRQRITEQISFFKDVLYSAIPTSVAFAIAFIFFEIILSGQELGFRSVNTILVLFTLFISISYSLYLVWESGKLRNLFLSIAVFIVLFSIGIFQTVLPLNLNENLRYNLFLGGVMFIASLISIFYLLKILKPKRFIYKVLISIASFTFFILASQFPFREYYSVERIQAIQLFDILLFGLVTTLIIILINQFVRRFLVN